MVTRYILVLLAVAGGPLLLLAQVGPAAERTHAMTQLSAILRDRPRLAVSLEPRPEVREWILEQFRKTVPPLFWDSKSPVSGRLAEWDGRDPEVTLLRIDGSPSGIDQLAHLLFELHNVKGYDVFDSIHEKAIRDEITRDEYASQMLAHEFRALLAARAFYRSHLSDLSQAEKREARSYYRLLHGTDSFEEHLREQRERGHDLFDHYRMLYDSMVIPERKERQKPGKE